MNEALPLLDRFLSASHLVLALWTGYGLALLGTILANPKPTADQSRNSASN